MTFHRWTGTDTDTLTIDADTQLVESQCFGCGVAAPEWQSGAPYFVTVAHGSLPIDCPGPEVHNPHHFFATGTDEDATLECHHCGGTVTAETLPADVVWECGSLG